MEKFTSNFNFEKSPAREAYVLLGAKTPLELNKKYTEEDQKLMRSGNWDYNNPDSIVNKVKDVLENISIDGLTEDEQDWRNEILWFWYHHAVSSAIYRYKDKEKAIHYSEVALSYQDDSHPNKITKLLNLLSNGDVDNAIKWTEQINEEPEKSTAESLVEEYKNGGFFK